MTAAAHLPELIKDAARAAGLELAGIASVREPDFPELEHFAEWVERGHAGEMKYLEARDAAGHLQRASLRHAAPWARSVIVCATRYDSPPPLSTECPDPQRAWISRYAWSREDYHLSVLRRLRQVEAALLAAVADQGGDAPRTWCYVDTGPVVERVYAKYAGVGWIGKNTCLIHQELGSYVFLGVILTALELAPDVPAPDRCGTCTRCIDACPTDALLQPYQLDSRRCISYLTIEKRGEIAEELRPGMGRHVFGCDICQDVCPWNQRARRVAPPAPHEEVREELVNPALAWLAALTEDDFRRIFRGSPVKRARFAGLRRNLAIAMGNSGSREFVPQLEAWARGDDSNLAAHARWALARLQPESCPEPATSASGAGP